MQRLLTYPTGDTPAGIWEYLDSVTLGDTASEMDITGISTSYDIYMLKGLAIPVLDDSNDYLYLRINDNSTDEYDFETIHNIAHNKTAGMNIGRDTYFGTTYGQREFTCYITPPSKFTTPSSFYDLITEAMYVQGGAGGTPEYQRNKGRLWSTSAISSIQVLSDASNNLASGSKMTLWGMDLPTS